jgi:serine/threonine protein kinase
MIKLDPQTFLLLLWSEKVIIKISIKISNINLLIRKILYIGSFGEVYLVEKINTLEKYAMKVLHKNQVLSNFLIFNK